MRPRVVVLLGAGRAVLLDAGFTVVALPAMDRAALRAAFPAAVAPG